MPLVFSFRRALCTVLLLLAASPAVVAQGANQTQQLPDPDTAAGGPIRLRQAAPAAIVPAAGSTPLGSEESLRLPTVPPYIAGEFERYIERSGTRDVRRLGSELVTSANDGRVAELLATAPADYVIASGDEVLLQLWGSVDADLRLVVDRNGRISVPRVGPIQVGGVRYADLVATVERRVATAFKNFQASVSLGQLRSVRVFVSGFVLRPGTYTVGALSTVVGAVMQAGGPSAAGSFRRIELKRAGKVVAQFDLYDLLLRGDRSADRLVQAGDVVHVGPVGTQVALLGSFNRPVIAELAGTESVADVLAMAGGFSALADRNRLMVERLSERSGRRINELLLTGEPPQRFSHGDVIRALNATDTTMSIGRQNVLIRVDGEVARPGEYVLPPDSTLQDALAAAGGLAPTAFVFGSQFIRASVRKTQQENYARALRDMEIDLARSSASQRITTAEDNQRVEAQTMATGRLIERLRALEPTGRVVLQLSIDSRELPSLLLEGGDSLYVPPRPTSVGVFGSVYNTGSYLYSDGRELGDYLRLAGGPTKGADEASAFVVRANGQVLSARQRETKWFRAGNPLVTERAEPGDTIFVPEEVDKSTLRQTAKDWTQILYQFGLGIAGIASAFK
jgi:protein involved in polysaccharide export with SLBB domain